MGGRRLRGPRLPLPVVAGVSVLAPFAVVSVRILQGTNLPAAPGVTVQVVDRGYVIHGHEERLVPCGPCAGAEDYDLIGLANALQEEAEEGPVGRLRMIAAPGISYELLLDSANAARRHPLTNATLFADIVVEPAD